MAEIINQFMGGILVILGLVAGIVALLEPLTQIVAIVIKYLRKLFAGPITTEPFASKQDERKSQV